MQKWYPLIACRRQEKRKNRAWATRQVTPPARDDLKRFGQLPKGWKTSLSANLTAGALYYADMSVKYNIPGIQAAAAYNEGPNPNKYTGAKGQAYQSAFNHRQAMMMNLVNCMR